jgi:adenine deaminase
MGIAADDAVQIATINTARHYRLRNFGAIAASVLGRFHCAGGLTDFQCGPNLQEGNTCGRAWKVFGAVARGSLATAQHDDLRYNPGEDLRVAAKEGAQIRVIEIIS